MLIREDYAGPLPEGTVIRTKSNFPFVFIRTQSFAINTDQLADAIRRQSQVSGAWQPIDRPNPKDTLALISWTIANGMPYAETKNLMAEAARTFSLLGHDPVHFAICSVDIAAQHNNSFKKMLRSTNDGVRCEVAMPWNAENDPSSGARRTAGQIVPQFEFGRAESTKRAVMPT